MRAVQRNLTRLGIRVTVDGQVPNGTRVFIYGNP